MPTAEEFVGAARELLGVPFQHQGRTKAGTDCVGVVLWAGKCTGLIPTAFELPAYTLPPAPHLFDEYLPKFADKVEGERRLGDIVVLAAKPGGKPRHLGIVSERGLVWMDRTASVGRVSECRLDSQMAACIVGVWRMRGLTE
jgi:cell wall-associated NlpC family hydrolase